jgi:hypothetical protein
MQNQSRLFSVTPEAAVLLGLVCALTVEGLSAEPKPVPEATT